MGVLDEGDVETAIQRTQVGLQHRGLGAQASQPQMPGRQPAECVGQVGGDETVVPGVVDQQFAGFGRQQVAQLPTRFPGPQLGVHPAQPDDRDARQPRAGHQVGDGVEYRRHAGQGGGRALLGVHHHQRGGVTLGESAHDPNPNQGHCP